MYIPRAYTLEDPRAIAEVIEEHSFGLLVTATGEEPVATQLPFMFDVERGSYGTLVSHMARANAQWQEFERYAEGGLALAIFAGPHAYVSPTWYGDAEPAVPTWNYVTVQAYGRPRIVDEPSKVRTLLERLVDRQEARLDPSWSLASQEDGYVERMMRGVVAFEMPIERIEAKAKLSQNKPDQARLGAADALEGGESAAARAIGRLMREAGSRG